MQAQRERSGVIRGVGVAFITAATFVLTLTIGVVVTQDFKIFPPAKDRFLYGPPNDPAPEGVEELIIPTTDGNTLSAWRLGSEPKEGRKRFVAVVFRGADGLLLSQFTFQAWFQKLGITSYLFNYRGYGKSTGWPSEQGLALDSEGVIRYVMEREGVTEKQLIFLGYSIGTGPSSLMAGKLHPRALILIAPFRELPAVIGEMPWYRYLKGFVWHRFPVRENVRALRDSCLAVVHGVRDQLIPPRQAEEVYQAYTGEQGKFVLLKEADHVDVFERAQDELVPFLDKCLYPLTKSPER